MPDKTPLVTVITVNYNQAAATCEMLESLFASDYTNLEVIVVDNASPSENPNIIGQQYPQIILIKSPVNGGFAAGNNIGILHASGKYIFMVNNDTVIPKGLIRQLAGALEADPNIGLVCPKVMYFDNPNMIQYAGQTKMSAITMQTFIKGNGEHDRGQYNQSEETHYVHGAAMMTTRNVIDTVGLLPEIYFLYYEELDWCERVRKAGYRIFYIHNAIIYHKESLSTGTNSPTKTYYLNRNRMIFLHTHRSGITRLVGILYLLLIAYPKNILYHLAQHDMPNTRSLLRAYRHSIAFLVQSGIKE